MCTISCTGRQSFGRRSSFEENETKICGSTVGLDTALGERIDFQGSETWSYFCSSFGPAVRNSFEGSEHSCEKETVEKGGTEPPTAAEPKVSFGLSLA